MFRRVLFVLCRTVIRQGRQVDKRSRGGRGLIAFKGCFRLLCFTCVYALKSLYLSKFYSRSNLRTYYLKHKHEHLRVF